MTKPITDDGFQVEYVVLASDENVLGFAKKWPKNETSAKLPNVTVSDLLRTVKIFDEVGKLKTILNHGHRIQIDEGDDQLIDTVN